MTSLSLTSLVTNDYECIFSFQLHPRIKNETKLVHSKFEKIKKKAKKNNFNYLISLLNRNF